MLVYGTESCLLGANWSGDAEMDFLLLSVGVLLSFYIINLISASVPRKWSKYLELGWESGLSITKEQFDNGEHIKSCSLLVNKFNDLLLIFQFSVLSLRPV